MDQSAGGSQGRSGSRTRTGYWTFTNRGRAIAFGGRAIQTEGEVRWIGRRERGSGQEVEVVEVGVVGRRGYSPPVATTPTAGNGAVAA